MRIWDNRVELWNPGTLPSNLSVETLLEAHESQPRNKLIANAFYLAGFIESWGRGYEKIQADFEAEKLQIPIFEQVRGGFMATIKRERFIEIGNKKHVEDSTQKSSQKSSQKILDLMRNNPNITLVELALSLNMTRRSIDKKIKILKEQEKIRRVGPDRGGHWEVL
jgi:ATP-dependent DNA helicase RecG